MSPYLKQRKTLRQKKQMVRAWLLSTTVRTTMAFVVIGFGIFFVVQTNTVSTKGFEISDLEKQIQTLKQENRTLEFQIAESGSMDSIQARVAELHMIPVDQIVYVTPVGTSVAKAH